MQQRLDVRPRAEAVLIASGALDTTGLPAGRYTASATVLQGNEPIARVSRLVDVASAPVPTTARATPSSSNAHEVDEVARRVARYVEQYGEQASLLVGIEHYDQRYTPAELGEPGARTLVSEFALVKTADGWTGFRDVVEVGGRPVAQRRDRLLTLFSTGSGDVVQARRIADESARFNIGSIVRNLNVPTTALFFFTPRNLSRFRFSRKAQETIDGQTVWELEFHEKGRPTFIRRANGQDLPAEGSLWVIPTDGTVIRTRLSVLGFTGSESSATIDVRYQRDRRLGLWLPARMEERYEGRVRSRRSVKLQMGLATATATYSDFKRFETSATISVK